MVANLGARLPILRLVLQKRQGLRSQCWESHRQLLLPVQLPLTALAVLAMGTLFAGIGLRVPVVPCMGCVSAPGQICGNVAN